MSTTTPPTDGAPPLTIWLTDRSRYRLGTGRCPMARYLGYHWGPTGYGITLRAEALPLATGLYVHYGVEAFCGVLKSRDTLPSLEETRLIIAEVRKAYTARVEDRGFRGILGGPQTEETIVEQSILISGLLWALRLKFLPWLHQTYRVLSVETERVHMLTCSCGAGALDFWEHVRRECNGKGLMLRTDILGLRRGGTTCAYFECKTTGWAGDAWAEQWEGDPQLGLGTLDVPQLHGAEVTELYVVGLDKGKRVRDRGDVEGRRKQQSALCYGYFRPGNPPLAADEWLPAYEWVNDAGEVKRAPRTHKREGIWKLAESDWPTWQAYHHQDPTLTPEEFWVRTLPASVMDKICFLLGPMDRQDDQIHSLRGSIVGEEDRWQQTLWRLYEAQQTMAWSSPEFQALLDELIPRSWNCRPFGKEAQCEFYQICHRHEGWQDPLAGAYQPRLPHHDPELRQAIARGLLPDQAAASEWETDA
jgi:hypothetical protein